MSVDTVVFPQPRPDPYTPPPGYRSRTGAGLRRCTLAYGGEAWLVTGLDIARAILADTVTFSSDSLRPNFPAFPLASKRPIPGHFLSMDPPEHTRLRQLVAGEFTASRVKALRPRIAAAVADLVEEMVAGGSPADLVAAIAVPLPAISAAAIIGTPVADRDFFVRCARALQVHDATVARRVAAAAPVNRYLEQAIATRRGTRRSDVLGRLAEAVYERGEITLAEAVGAANLIVVAGLETTAGLLTLTMLSLLRDERQAALVRADPRRWAGPAVLEGLRYWTVVQHGVIRQATRDAVLDGEQIRAGDAIVISLPSVNRDPAAHPAPDTFDITRDAHAQLAFGHGPHRCLGGYVAQVQAELAVGTLMRRLPGLRLVERDADLSFLDEMLIYGLSRMRVAW